MAKNILEDDDVQAALSGGGGGARRRRSRPPPALLTALGVYALMGAFVALLFSSVLIVQRPSHNVPAPPPADTVVPATEFSEASAFLVMEQLVQLAVAEAGQPRPDGNLAVVGAPALCGPGRGAHRAGPTQVV
jgi:hypothetical protein